MRLLISRDVGVGVADVAVEERYSQAKRWSALHRSGNAPTALDKTADEGVGGIDDVSRKARKSSRALGGGKTIKSRTPSAVIIAMSAPPLQAITRVGKAGILALTGAYRHGAWRRAIYVPAIRKGKNGLTPTYGGCSGKVISILAAGLVVFIWPLRTALSGVGRDFFIKALRNLKDSNGRTCRAMGDVAKGNAG